MEGFEVENERGIEPNRFVMEKAPEGKNQALYIEQPDEVMRRVVHRVLGSQRSGHPDYEAARTVGAFFQTGHEADSEEIMIEFWKGDIAAHRAFVEHLKAKYKTALEEES